MNIRFTKKRLRHYLIFGTLWLVIGTIAVILNSENIFNYGYLLIGVLYFGAYLFENNKQYLTIENGILSKNQLVPKKIKLDEVNQVKKFAGDYILKTGSNELRINTELIEEESLADLNDVLEKLNVEGK